MKLNGYIKEIEKNRKARKRVYKILGVSDEFVPNLEALIKNNDRIKDLFNELLDYQLNHKNDLKIAKPRTGPQNFSLAIFKSFL